MKKTNILMIVLNLIFLIVFNVFFFMLGGTDHKASVWISYAFIHIAYLLMAATPFITAKSKSSSVFGLALYTISSGYFLVQFVVGVFFILIKLNGIKAAILVQLLLAAVYSIILLVNMIANEKTADAEVKRQFQIAYVKDASAKLSLLKDKVSDKDLKKKVEKVYDAVYTSPIKSHPEIAQLESKILQSINELENAIMAEDTDAITTITDSLHGAITERNTRLKLFN